jgi:hypothetical protein
LRLTTNMEGRRWRESTVSLGGCEMEGACRFGSIRLPNCTGAATSPFASFDLVNLLKKSWVGPNRRRMAIQKPLNLVENIHRLRPKIMTFNLPFLSLPVGTSNDVALDVFIKMNTSLVPLTPFDVVVAQVEAASGEAMHDLIAALKTTVPSLEFYGKPSDLVLAVGALRADKPPTSANFLRRDSINTLIAEWKQIASGIAFAIRFLEGEGIWDEVRLPTTAVLPVLGALGDLVPPALDQLGAAKTYLRQYIWRAFFCGRYENSAATRSLQDYRGLRSLLLASADKPPILDETEYPLPTTDELKTAGWPKARDTLARAILAVSLRGGERPR